MTTLIFVHGTGVREAEYIASFASIKEALRARQDIQLGHCYWGHLGARLNAGGASVPTYDSARGAETGLEPTADRDIDVGLWGLLYLDPLVELAALSLRNAGHKELVPGTVTPGQELAQLAASFRLSVDLRAKADRGGVGEVFRDAQAAVIATAAYRDALRSAPSALAEYRSAIARAWVAEAAIRSEERFGYPPLAWTDACLRDEIVALLVDALGGQEYGIGDWVRRRLGTLALKVGGSIGTRYARQRRGALTDVAYPFAGDILLYQARGHEIRGYIRDCVSRAQPPVVLLAHSLGGIACVDLLVAGSIGVELLVTVGSQAPFLYEIGALSSMVYGTFLPDWFPPWLNIYDRKDLMSYVGAGVFQGRVQDVEVDNQQPFPTAHSSYWSNPLVWNAIFRNLK